MILNSLNFSSLIKVSYEISTRRETFWDDETRDESMHSRVELPRKAVASFVSAAFLGSRVCV